MLFPHQGIVEVGGLHASLGRAAITTCSHAVQFYESDALFLDSLSEFVGSALGAGSVCMVVATPSHFHGLADRLAVFGVDLDLAIAGNRCFVLDAEHTLSSFMQSGWPDERLFHQTLEPHLQVARSALCQPASSAGSSIVVFGEMVSILCERGQFDAAHRLEELWNQLARRHAISLRCAYPINLFANHGRKSNFHRICAEHSEVIPAESFTSLNHSDRWRMVSSLQQQASSLQDAIELHQRESEQRIRVEEKLRQTQEFANTIVDSSADC